jgi:hypothetical protein
VQGNLIGTDASGFSDLGNVGFGLWVSGSDNVIGGRERGKGNVISGNAGDGIQISQDRNRVQGNVIGVGIEGDPLGNDGHGVVVVFGEGNEIGGEADGAGNTIAFNKRSGVRVNSGISNPILSNSIVDNGLLGIDLGGDDVSPNDSGDPDIGANALQNFPDLFDVSVFPVSGVTKIEGSLDSTPNTEFLLQFFSNPLCDPSFHGEGQALFGSGVVITDATGTATFAFAFPVTLPEGSEVAATATDFEAMNNTSEFSSCRTSHLG